jgi:hypothetical protein
MQKYLLFSTYNTNTSIVNKSLYLSSHIIFHWMMYVAVKSHSSNTLRCLFFVLSVFLLVINTKMQSFFCSMLILKKKITRWKLHWQKAIEKSFVTITNNVRILPRIKPTINNYILKKMLWIIAATVLRYISNEYYIHANSCVLFSFLFIFIKKSVALAG